MIYVIWILSALIAAAIGAKKGEGILGFIIGIIFGPLGVIFALLSKGNRVKCPACKELINKDASRCPKCTSIVTENST